MRARTTALLLALSVLLLSSTVLCAGGEIEPLFEKTRRTVPDTLPWYHLIVFGDNRPEDTRFTVFPSVFYRMVEEASRLRPIAVIGTGDHVGRGYERQYHELYRTLTMAGLENLWLAVGNHDVEALEGRANWARYVGPESYYIDDIPGWRIGIVSSEVGSARAWLRQLERVYNGLDNRSLILVFHKPILPDVGHNIRREWIPATMEFLERHGYPRIVLQGHWHGWACETRNDTAWIITGGAGSPLYELRVSVKPGSRELVAGVHHYVVLILYPNQTYRLYPVSINGGDLHVVRLNSTTILVSNTKLDVHGRPVSMPVRVRLSISGVEFYIVLMAPAMSNVVVSYSLEEASRVAIKSNASTWYAYAYSTASPDSSPVYLPANNTVVVNLEELASVGASRASTPSHVVLEESQNTIYQHAQAMVFLVVGVLACTAILRLSRA